MNMVRDWVGCEASDIFRRGQLFWSNRKKCDAWNQKKQSAGPEPSGKTNLRPTAVEKAVTTLPRFRSQIIALRIKATFQTRPTTVN